MDSLPTIAELLRDTHVAMANTFGSKVMHRDRYGHVIFDTALRTAVLLALLEWAGQPASEPVDQTALIDALAKLTTAVYRSA